MNEQLKKFTAELKEKFSASIQSKEMQEAIASIKAAQDTGSFEVVISTADVDRAGEIVDQNGWMLDHYKNNPIVLWAHDYSQLPIGVCDSIDLKDGKLTAKGRFAPHEFAQNVRQLYDLKMIRATSVGFIPLEMEGNTITSAELLEFSFVPVPANPFALSLAKSSNLNVAELITKGLLTKEAEGTADEPAKDGNEAVKPESEAVEGEKPQENAENADNPENQPKEPAAAADTEKAQAKGAVADEISADQEWEKKWEMISPFDDIIYAFYDVYFDENTAADQFQALLKETIGLLGQLVDGSGTTEASMKMTARIISTKEANWKQVIAKMLAKKNGMKAMTMDEMKQMIGAAMTDMQNKVDSAIVECGQSIQGSLDSEQQPADNTGKSGEAKILDAINALKGEIIAAVELKLGGGEREDVSDGNGANQRSVGEGFADSLKSLDDFLAMKQVLRTVNNAVDKALESINRRQKDIVKNKN